MVLATVISTMALFAIIRQVNQMENAGGVINDISVIFLITLTVFMVLLVIIVEGITIKERKIDKMKTEFISLASHQLRAPLTAMSWLVEIFNKKAINLDVQQKGLLQDIYQSTAKMIDLVNDLLNVSRLESGALAVSPELTQFEDIIREVIKEESLLLNKKNCQVVFEKYRQEFPKILLDKCLIKQAFHNLLINAVRYSRNGCQVEVKLEKRDKDYLFTIADNGIGIPRDKQHRVFEKFFRADNAQKMHPDGTGLGLYITKMIVESAGGKIWFISEENKGTKFFVAFPPTGMKERLSGKKLIR